MKLSRIAALVRAFFNPAGTPINAASLASSYALIPGGITPDNVGMWGLTGFMQNQNTFDSYALTAVNGGAAAAVTLTTAQLLTSIIDFTSTNGSGITVTTPTAAQIIAAMPATTPKNGFSWNLNFMNDNTGQTVTFAAGANVTLNATTATIATNTSRNFLVNVNINAGTVTIVGIGGGAAL